MMKLNKDIGKKILMLIVWYVLGVLTSILLKM